MKILFLPKFGKIYIEKRDYMSINKCILAVGLSGLLFLLSGCSNSLLDQIPSKQERNLKIIEQRCISANGWNAKVIHADIGSTGYVYEHTVLLTNPTTGEEYICTYSEQGTAITPRIYNHKGFTN